MKLRRSSVARVISSFAHLDLGDPRRERRVGRVVSKMARQPSAPLPAALRSDAEVQAAYRLMNNRRVNFETLLTVQAEVTRQRAEESGDVLVLHDTTDCEFPDLDPNEIGYLQTGKAGFRLHHGLVVDANGWRRPLGTVHAETIHRPRRRKGPSRKRSGTETSRAKDREFERWRRGIAATAARLQGCRSVIHIADRESDSYELMHAALASNQRFVFRVRVDRRGRKADAGDSNDWSTIKKVAATAEGLLEREVPLSRRKAKSAPGMNKAYPPRMRRLARLRFSATRVEIPRPQYLCAPLPPTLTLNLVHVFEPDPPEGEPAIEWLLYTTEPVDTAAQVEGVVDHYRTRWFIEEFHAALKTGAAYEDRQFETRHALLNMLALSLPMACEVLALRSRARSNPDLPAKEVLTQLQIRVLRKLGSYKLPANPTAKDVLLAVAALGGHLKRNGPPGWKVLSRGMTLLLAYEAAWEAGAASRR